MFMSDNKKKAAMIIAHHGDITAGKFQQGDPRARIGDDYDPGDGYLAAAQEMIDAIHAKDSDGVSKALKSFVSMHRDEPEESSDAPDTASEKKGISEQV